MKKERIIIFLLLSFGVSIYSQGLKRYYFEYIKITNTHGGYVNENLVTGIEKIKIEKDSTTYIVRIRLNDEYIPVLLLDSVNSYGDFWFKLRMDTIKEHSESCCYSEFIFKIKFENIANTRKLFFDGTEIKFIDNINNFRYQLPNSLIELYRPTDLKKIQLDNLVRCYTKRVIFGNEIYNNEIAIESFYGIEGNLVKEIYYYEDGTTTVQEYKTIIW
jgi:hypothetical protein